MPLAGSEPQNLSRRTAAEIGVSQISIGVYIQTLQCELMADGAMSEWQWQWQDEELREMSVPLLLGPSEVTVGLRPIQSLFCEASANNLLLMGVKTISYWEIIMLVTSNTSTCTNFSPSDVAGNSAPVLFNAFIDILECSWA
jgi:hypothetical protein